jgi:hypothetical protein
VPLERGNMPAIPAAANSHLSKTRHKFSQLPRSGNRRGLQEDAGPFTVVSQQNRRRVSENGSRSPL